jgi:hypothetical protein
MTTKTRAFLSLLLAAAWLSTSLGYANAAPCPPDAPSVPQWFNAIAMAEVGRKNNTNQTEVPSVATSSPSLVDQSSASDLVGIGLNLIGVASESADTTDTSATVSAYAIRAALTGENPMRPEYYVANSNWRRLFFTLGADFPEEGGDEKERGIIGGVKVIVHTERDIGANFKTFSEDANSLLTKAGKGLAETINEPVVLAIIDGATCEFPPNAPTQGEGIDESRITPAMVSQIKDVMRTKGQSWLDYQTNAATLADEINKRPQFAVEFLTNQRQNDGTDEYSAVLTADWGAEMDIGLIDRIAFTVNGSYEGVDKAKDEDDSHGGKLGAQMRFFKKQDQIDKRVPWLASLAADGRWLTEEKPRYRVQAKFTLAILDGIDLPLSVTYATTSDFNEENEVIGNIGFTFDTAKLLERFGG